MMSTVVICNIEKLIMDTHDTKCPSWDQAGVIKQHKAQPQI